MFLVVTLVAAMVGGGLAWAEATESGGIRISLDPVGVLQQSTSLVFADGDHVVFHVDGSGHQRHDAKGTAGGDGPVVHEGFTTYGDAKTLPGYRIRLVDSPGVEGLRPTVEQAAEAAMDAAAPLLDVAAGTLPDGSRLTRGEIHVVVTSAGPCVGSWLGCGGPVIERGVVVAGRIWINPRVMRRSQSVIGNTVRHELGHTLGLGHYGSLFEGRIQTMHNTSFDARTYESGDRNGFSFVSGRQPEAPAASARISTAAPARGPADRPVNPAGMIESAAPTPLGIVVRGWAVDADSSGPVSVLVTVDGAPTEALAHGERTGGGSGGFTVAVPAGAGVHEVCAVARNSGPGTDTSLGCRAVEVTDDSIGSVGLQTL